VDVYLPMGEQKIAPFETVTHFLSRRDDTGNPFVPCPRTSKAHTHTGESP